MRMPRPPAAAAALALCFCAAVPPFVSAGNFPQAVVTHARRFLNLGSLLGSATHADTPYDRIAGHPVFAITTSWGSPYMNMEKLSDLDEVVPPNDSKSQKENQADNIRQANMDESEEFRNVVLYFMDQDDALGVHSEMKQMDQMAQADLRLTSFSLSKALRQAANLGQGLPTGAPPDALTGLLKSPAEGGSLRYKIVPPKRQLYYAARCQGRERVGLFGGEADAATAIQGNWEAANLERRRLKKERKGQEQKRTPMQLANLHMEGRLGIPVFYHPQLQRVPNVLKRILTGTPHEVPLFFNYEDLMDAWHTVQQRNAKAGMPETPSAVEVFNLWDVLTSMDRAQFQARQKPQLVWKALLKPVTQRLPSQAPPTLQHVTFVPSSRSVTYKESLSKRGNGKARLRPMR